MFWAKESEKKNMMPFPGSLSDLTSHQWLTKEEGGKHSMHLRLTKLTLQKTVKWLNESA